MSNRLMNNFKRYYPGFYEETIEIREKIFYEIIAELKDGCRILYDDLEHTFRILPKDCNNMTEEECKLEFGKSLYKIMLRKNITEKKLSEMTGISQPRLSNYISGKTSPSFYKVDKIAKALNCSIDELRYIW